MCYNEITCVVCRIFLALQTAGGQRLRGRRRHGVRRRGLPDNVLRADQLQTIVLRLSPPPRHRRRPRPRLLKYVLLERASSSSIRFMVLWCLWDDYNLIRVVSVIHIADIIIHTMITHIIIILYTSMAYTIFIFSIINDGFSLPLNFMIIGIVNSWYLFKYCSRTKYRFKFTAVQKTKINNLHTVPTSLTRNRHTDTHWHTQTQTHTHTDTHRHTHTHTQTQTHTHTHTHTRTHTRTHTHTHPHTHMNTHYIDTYAKATGWK